MKPQRRSRETGQTTRGAKVIIKGGSGRPFSLSDWSKKGRSVRAPDPSEY